MELLCQNCFAGLLNWRKNVNEIFLNTQLQWNAINYDPTVAAAEHFNL